MVPSSPGAVQWSTTVESAPVGAWARAGRSIRSTNSPPTNAATRIHSGILSVRAVLVSSVGSWYRMLSFPLPARRARLPKRRAAIDPVRVHGGSAGIGREAVLHLTIGSPVALRPALSGSLL